MRSLTITPGVSIPDIAAPDGHQMRSPCSADSGSSAGLPLSRVTLPSQQMDSVGGGDGALGEKFPANVRT